jgi:hypothetical protein
VHFDDWKKERARERQEENEECRSPFTRINYIEIIPFSRFRLLLSLWLVRCFIRTTRWHVLNVRLKNNCKRERQRDRNNISVNFNNITNEKERQAQTQNGQLFNADDEEKINFYGHR